MKFQRLFCFRIAAAAALIAAATAVHAVDTEPSNLEPEMIAKLAKDKAHRDAAVNSDSALPGGDMVFNGASAGRSSCGNVDIGNIVSTSPGWRGPQQITVVVTGDVVNAGNNCKK